MKRILIATAVLAAIASPAPAKERVVFVESDMVKDKPAVSLDPAKAYVLVRSDSMVTLHLMRVPSAEDQVKYDALKAEAFAEAWRKYEKKKASYDKAKASYDKDPKRFFKPTPIAELTEANFEFPSFGLMTGVVIGPQNRFAKGEGASTYLQQITPGSYRIYSAALGECFCMGSVKFEVKASEITDLGYFETPAVEQVKSDAAKPVSYAPRYRAADASAPVDPRLASMKLIPAALRPVGKLPNYFGGRIDRFPAIDGVMRYDRDRVVDLTAGQ